MACGAVGFVNGLIEPSWTFEGCRFCCQKINSLVAMRKRKNERDFITFLSVNFKSCIHCSF